MTTDFENVVLRKTRLKLNLPAFYTLEAALLQIIYIPK